MITNNPTATERKGRFQIAWTVDSAVKRVEITNQETGRSTVGADWANWDTAYEQALHQMFSPRGLGTAVDFG